MTRIIIDFLSILPELIKLIKNLQKRADDLEKKRLIKEDIKKINKAFEDNDNEALNTIFNS